MNVNGQSTRSLACKLDALNGEQRERHQALWQQLQGSAAGNRELPDGYAFGFSMDNTLFVNAAEYITLERLCCPFLHFSRGILLAEVGRWRRGQGILDVHAIM
jgi:hypothetical protein